MTRDQPERETLLVDLTDIDLNAIAALPPNALRISLDHLLGEQADQMDSFLGFHNAFSALDQERAD